jgi:hypothetical protein
VVLARDQLKKENCEAGIRLIRIRTGKEERGWRQEQGRGRGGEGEGEGEGEGKGKRGAVAILASGQEKKENCGKGNYFIPYW